MRGTDLAGNPNFDAGLAGWTVVATVPGEVAADLDDAGEQPTSGSVAVTSSAGAGETWQVEQCVALPAHGWSRLSGRLRSASALPGAPVAHLEAQYFGSADCSSGALSALLSPAVAGDTGAVWVTVASGGAPFPAGAHSASVRLIVEAGTTNDVDLRADELFFGDDGLLFADGFESGGTGILVVGGALSRSSVEEGTSPCPVRRRARASRPHACTLGDPDAGLGPWEIEGELGRELARAGGAGR